MGNVNERIRVVHFHGVVQGKDHRSLREVSPSIVHSVLNRAPHNRVTTVEVFGEEKFVDSMQYLNELHEGARDEK